MSHPGQRFFDRVVVIVGGASGIGAETARRFADEGARVVIADRDLVKAQSVADTIGDAFAHEVDAADPDSVRRLGHFVADRIGSLDVLINGAYAISEGSFLEVSPQSLLRDVEVTLGGPMLVTQALLPTMINTGGGVVLSLASVNGLGWFGGHAYSVAKAGVVHFTRCIAAEFGDRGVRACAVAPGTVETPAWDKAKDDEPGILERLGRAYPLGRIGQPSDIADALLFLASDEASWVTGVTLPVEGGILLTNRFDSE